MVINRVRDNIQRSVGYSQCINTTASGTKNCNSGIYLRAALFHGPGKLERPTAYAAQVAP
jgi:hypothetical protein